MKFRSLMTAICVLATANIVSAAPFAYIANSGTHNVTVIDTATNLKVTDVALPDTNPVKDPYAYGVAVGASGQYVYVGIQDTNEVAVIDAATNVVVKRIGLGGDQPGGLAVNTAETRLYVASNKSNTLIVIDITGTSAAEVGRVNVDDSPISNPEGVVLSPDGLKAYVANSSKGTVAEIALDETTNVYTRTNLISLGSNSQPYGLTINSTGTKLYAASLNGTASVVDTATRTATDLVVNTGNLSVAITPDNSKIYAPSSGFNNMYSINGANNAVTALGGQNSLLNSPWGSSVTPGGAKLYVAMNLSDNVKVFDTSTDLEIAPPISLPVGAKPTSIGDFIGPVFPYTITSTQGSLCNILPLGAIPVNYYGRNFTVFPTSGTCEVKVSLTGLPQDLVSVGQPSSYSFTDVSDNYLIDASQRAGTFYTLSGDWISSVGGCLQSDAPYPGISCSSKSAKFPENSTVTLKATTGFKVQSGTWTGACAGTSGSTCSVLMNADKNFGTLVPVAAPVIVLAGGTGPIYSGGSYYQTLAEAVAAVANGAVIKISSAYNAGGTTNGSAAQVTLSCNWNADFSGPSGSPYSMGQLIIGTTGVIVDPTPGYTMVI